MLMSNPPLVALFLICLPYAVIASPIAKPLSIVESTDADDVPPPTRTTDYITIITDADVTWCRPWPNTAIQHQNSAHFYRGTVLNFTCWVPNDIPEPVDGPGLSQPIDIWVKTGDNGCYVNENDLRSSDVNFEDALGLCAPAGPHHLAGNRPPDSGSSLGPIPNPSPALSNPSAVLPNPSLALPNPSPLMSSAGSALPNPNVAPVFPNPSMVFPGPANYPKPVSPAQPPALAKPSPIAENLNLPPLLPNPSLLPQLPAPLKSAPSPVIAPPKNGNGTQVLLHPLAPQTTGSGTVTVLRRMA